MTGDNKRISHENVLWRLFRGLVEETVVPECILKAVKEKIRIKNEEA